ncbi:MAG: CGLD27 family protein [Oscillatoriophycideae cyanobacterium NC_groundwater_1537_Pr4_S-0.65um_50_18]|nr:CGLD27 family protein [Oscillatoriophycideae cyanobacterium NC_groundwater_1537_Pr4_S-0.65um_50_18]
MPSSAPVCPVPTEQQPINEYQELKESWFFRWATLNLQGFIKPIIVLWLASWLIAGPVAATSFHLSKHPAQFFIFGAAGAMVIPLLALLRLYLGWVYVCDRLSNATIFYEESGWYDGQEWTKPEEVLQRDNLIVNYQLKSLLQRLKLTFGVIAALFILGGVLWMFL